MRALLAPLIAAALFFIVPANAEPGGVYDCPPSVMEFVKSGNATMSAADQAGLKCVAAANDAAETVRCIGSALVLVDMDTGEEIAKGSKRAWRGEVVTVVKWDRYPTHDAVTIRVVDEDNEEKPEKIGAKIVER